MYKVYLNDQESTGFFISEQAFQELQAAFEANKGGFLFRPEGGNGVIFANLRHVICVIQTGPNGLGLA